MMSYTIFSNIQTVYIDRHIGLSMQTWPNHSSGQTSLPLLGGSKLPDTPGDTAQLPESVVTLYLGK